MKKKILLPIIIAVVAVVLATIVAITIYTGKYGKNATVYASEENEDEVSKEEINTEAVSEGAMSEDEASKIEVNTDGASEELENSEDVSAETQNLEGLSEEERFLVELEKIEGDYTYEEAKELSGDQLIYVDKCYGTLGYLYFKDAEVSLAGIETVFMIKAATTKPSEDATVVVLGCRAYGSRPSIMLATRLDAAYEYLTENPRAVCIVSGGQGPDETMPEAECMYLYLTEKGIAPERIYREDKSTSTRENLLFSQEIIEAEGLNPEIAIVTNEYHEYRASMVGHALEMECSSIPASTPLWLFPTYYIRELYGIIYEQTLI